MSCHPASRSKSNSLPDSVCFHSRTLYATSILGRCARSALTILVMGCAGIASIPPAVAQTGGVIIRIDDSAPSRCIDGQKDTVWLTLRRLKTTKVKGWFTQNSGVGVLVNAGVRTDPVPPKPISFPLMTDANFEDAAAGQVSLPVEYTLIESLQLVQKDGHGQSVRYSGLDIDLTLLNQNKATTWGKALQTLDQVAKKLPLPSNPVTQGATYLLDVANNAVSDAVQKQSPSDAYKTAALALNFDKAGQCSSSDFEKTGTLAVVMDAGAPGFIPVATVDSYCWTAKLKPAFILQAGKKTTAASSCKTDADHQAFAEVTNNYIGFVLSAEASTTNLAGPPRSDIDAAEARCRANGLPLKACR